MLLNGGRLGRMALAGCDASLSQPVGDSCMQTSMATSVFPLLVSHLQGMRQDCTVQHIRNDLAVQVGAVICLDSAVTQWGYPAVQHARNDLAVQVELLTVVLLHSCGGNVGFAGCAAHPQWLGSAGALGHGCAFVLICQCRPPFWPCHTTAMCRCTRRMRVPHLSTATWRSTTSARASCACCTTVRARHGWFLSGTMGVQGARIRSQLRVLHNGEKGRRISHLSEA